MSYPTAYRTASARAYAISDTGFQSGSRPPATSPSPGAGASVVNLDIARNVRTGNVRIDKKYQPFDVTKYQKFDPMNRTKWAPVKPSYGAPYVNGGYVQKPLIDLTRNPFGKRVPASMMVNMGTKIAIGQLVSRAVPNPVLRFLLKILIDLYGDKLARYLWARLGWLDVSASACDNGLARHIWGNFGHICSVAAQPAVPYAQASNNIAVSDGVDWRAHYWQVNSNPIVLPNVNATPSARVTWPLANGYTSGMPRPLMSIAPDAGLRSSAPALRRALAIFNPEVMPILQPAGHPVTVPHKAINKLPNVRPRLPFMGLVGYEPQGEPKYDERVVPRIPVRPRITVNPYDPGVLRPVVLPTGEVSVRPVARFIPDTTVVIEPGMPPTRIPSRFPSKPFRRVHERKLKLRSSILAAYNFVTEVDDVVDALYWAVVIPTRGKRHLYKHIKAAFWKDPLGHWHKSSPTLQAKMAFVYIHWKDINMKKAAHNLLANEVQDRVYGTIGQFNAHYNKVFGRPAQGPGTVQAHIPRLK